jgi:thymidylate synthase (FAD)
LAVELIWITPNTETLITYMARVSNPNAKLDDPSEKLIKYLIDHKHWSPFEMASMCVEIETTRDIARQILRHRSLHFQESSQRYAEVKQDYRYRPARLQDKTNRQNSIVCDDESLKYSWASDQYEVWGLCMSRYRDALKRGIAKEVARAILPEGLILTKMYMQGTIRDWIHYLSVRLDKSTQLEHRLVASDIYKILYKECPTISAAANKAGVLPTLGETYDQTR